MPNRSTMMENYRKLRGDGGGFWNTPLNHEAFNRAKIITYLFKTGAKFRPIFFPAIGRFTIRGFVPGQNSALIFLPELCASGDIGTVFKYDRLLHIISGRTE